MRNYKYKEFYYWENLIVKNENLTEGYFRGIPLSKESVFVNTVIVNCDTSVLYDWWMCFPDTTAALGFIHNIYITSAFNSHLSPEDDCVSIVNGTAEELFESLESDENCSKREDIAEMRDFLKEIEGIWLQDEKNILMELKKYSQRFNNRWGGINKVFSYFNVFESPEEVGRYVIEGYEAENIIEYFEEETGLTKEQWEDIYLNIHNNEFMKKRFMDILNNKISNLL